ncbi:MAG: GspH/FimT family pseudopilin [Candidatus Aquirickettsiella sp.]
MCKKTIRPRSYRTKWIIKPYKKGLFELGFSLIELLFTITLSSILLTLTFPVYRHFILELRLFILTERVNSTLHYAQSEAIRRQRVITICKSKDGLSSLGSWKKGWIVIVNKNSTPSFKNGELLRIYPTLSHSDFLEWHGLRSDDFLQLYPDGSSQNGSFIVCVHELSKKMVWLIKISQTGRIRIDRKNTKNLDCNA